MKPGYRALGEAAAWADLPGRKLLSVAGPDSLRFLNAILAADLRPLTDGQGCYSLLLDARGRIVADAHVFRSNGQYLLDTECESLGAHLERFLIADDAVVRDCAGAAECLFVEGPDSPRVLNALGLPRPAAKPGITAWVGGWVLQASVTGAQGYRVFAPTAVLDGVKRKLAGLGVAAADSDDIRTVRLEFGKPRWGEEFSSRCLGLEIGVPGAIGQSKGCYLGQEVVERVRARGLLDRLLVAIRSAGADELPAGETLLSGHVKAGRVASSAYSPKMRQVVGLAYLRIPFLQQSAPLTCGAGGVPVTVLHSN